MIDKILKRPDQEALIRLVREAEKQTGSEIVLSVVRRSDSYPEIPWKAFALGTSAAGLAVAVYNLFFSGWVSNYLILLAVVAPLATGATLGLLTVQFAGLARLFLSDHRRESEPMQYAQAMFLEHELFRTKDRKGVLLLVSHFERRVVILPDRGLRESLREGLLDGIVAEMVPLLRRNRVREALETGLAGLGKLMGTAAAGDPGNELPDAIIEEEGV